MPTTYSSDAATIAFGRQTAEGSALVTPKYEIPMGSGSVRPVRNVEALDWTSDSQDDVGHYVSLNAVEVGADLPVLPVSCVSLFQAVLGARTTSGAGPFTHTLTPADSLPFFTWFYRQPGNDYWTASDLKLGEFELSFDAGSPLTLSVSGTGKSWTRSDTKWGAATLVEGVTPFFTYIGATVRLEHSTSPAATQVRNVPGGSITCSRNIENIQTDTLGYYAMAETSRSFEVALNDVVLEDNDFLNAIHTGSTSGTTPSSQPLYGSAEFVFRGSDEAAAATRGVTVTVPRILWEADIPEADPGGAPARLNLTGRVSKPASGATFTVVVVNGDAGTNY
jgi:hypothetical protein